MVLEIVSFVRSRFALPPSRDSDRSEIALETLTPFRAISD